MRTRGGKNAKRSGGGDGGKAGQKRSRDQRDVTISATVDAAEKIENTTSASTTTTPASVIAKKKQKINESEVRIGLTTTGI